MDYALTSNLEPDMYSMNLITVLGRRTPVGTSHVGNKFGRALPVPTRNYD